MSHCRSFATAIAVLLLSAPLAAQGVSQEATPKVALMVAAPAPGDSMPLAALGPTRDNAIAAVRVVATTSAPARAFTPTEHASGTAMMIVGGSALLVGAIVGGRAGTAVMIGGGVLGLVGLWRYLN
jgi:hypothetical protein